VKARVVGTIPRVNPHVPLADVDNARRLADESKIELILTIGGGSATGLGKAVALDVGSPIMAIPTTYAGSEVTPIYGITGSGRKRTGRDDSVLPKTVLYDPALTTTLPPRVTASTGMNAIAHCIEALYADDSTPISDILAEEALRALVEGLPICVKEASNTSGRTLAMYGAYLAGSVLAATGMAVHHRMCHVLGGSFGLPHGDVNAVILPHAVGFNELATRESLEGVTVILGTESTALGLYELSQSLGAPTSLRELGMDHDDLKQAARLIDEGGGYNPREVDRADVLRILEAAFEGRPPQLSPWEGR
jgi:maleylacetate reductase